MADLKPCPFCNGEKIRDGHVRDGRRIYCADCGASVTAFQPNASASASSLWNCRPREDTDENASLRQQLAEARETVRREALEEAAKVAEHHSPEWLASDQSLDWNTGRSVGRRGAAIAIRALSHPDREGERPSEAETAARIVDTQAQYYAGHNEDIAKALREAAGAIRVQARPGREGERG